jgi:hypothetical protein
MLKIQNSKYLIPDYASLLKCHCEEQSDVAIPTSEIASLSLAMTMFKSVPKIKNSFKDLNL